MMKYKYIKIEVYKNIDLYQLFLCVFLRTRTLFSDQLHDPV